MTLRDNITRGRAKGLWTGVTGELNGVPLGRKARYGSVSEMHVLSFACSRRGYGLRPPISSDRGGVCGLSRLIHPDRTKVVVDGQFEAVLGKTRRTEF